jgi:hypothetical protein
MSLTRRLDEARKAFRRGDPAGKRHRVRSQPRELHLSHPALQYSPCAGN